MFLRVGLQGNSWIEVGAAFLVVGLDGGVETVAMEGSAIFITVLGLLGQPDSAGILCVLMERGLVGGVDLEPRRGNA